MRNDYLDYLMHYGVIGMKWGHRKDKGEVLYKKLVTNRPLKSNSFDHDNKIRRLNSKSAVKKVQSAKTPKEKEKATKEANKAVKETKDKGKRWFEQSLKAGKDKPKISAAEKVTQTSEKGVSDLVKLRNLRDTHKNNKSAAKSLSEISTEDLRKIVAGAKERSALEDDYRKYVANSVSSGRKRTTETLETLGAMLAVAGSAVTIVSTIKSFKNGKKDDE